jgi:hypothetical protein
MELFFKVLSTFIDLITSLVLLLINALSKLPFLGERGAIIVIVTIFFISLILCSVFCIVIFRKKEYKISVSLLISLLLMVAYYFILSYNIGHKAE